MNEASLFNSMGGTSFKLKTFENVGYNTVGKVIIMIFQFAANVILARNLISSDYGITGFALIFTGFLSKFGDYRIRDCRFTES